MSHLRVGTRASGCQRFVATPATFLAQSCRWAAILILVAGHASAQVAADGALDTRLKRLEGELRCLVCQNQTLADSNAPLAEDLRREVRELAVGGKSDDQIRAFLTERYGDFVLYNPPVKRTTWLLWFGPFVLLAGGALMWWKIGRNPTSPVSGTRDSPSRDDDATAAARGQALLDAPLPESAREPRRAAPGSRSPAKR